MGLDFHVQEQREEGREVLLRRGIVAPTVIYLIQTTVAAMALAPGNLPLWLN